MYAYIGTRYTCVLCTLNAYSNIICNIRACVQRMYKQTRTHTHGHAGHEDFYP